MEPPNEFGYNCRCKTTVMYEISIATEMPESNLLGIGDHKQISPTNFQGLDVAKFTRGVIPALVHVVKDILISRRSSERWVRKLESYSLPRH